MKKIVFVNLNVGSAIESSGNQIIKWTRQITNNISVFKTQDREETFFNFLLEENPDIVIVNSLYARIITPLLFYKLNNPDIKIILVPRTFDEIVVNTNNTDNTNIHEVHYNSRLVSLLKLTDFIFVVNSCGYKNRIPEWLSNKCFDCCGTNSKDKFYIKTPWAKRTKKFVILGSLNPHKVSVDFINKIEGTNIQIDAYGNTNNQPEWFAKIFQECDNIHYKGKVEQDEVVNVLNEYKYYLLPHNGHEPLCNSLHQAILCGCIPIVFDDYAKDINGDYWLEFAKGMYFGCDKMEDYINAIQDIDRKDFQNGVEISEHNRDKYLEKYEQNFVKNYKEVLRRLLNE